MNTVITDFRDLPKKIQDGIKGIRALDKDCHNTALKVAGRLPVNIVQGYFFCFKNGWVEHSWNELDGIEFDLTVIRWRKRHPKGQKPLGYREVRRYTGNEYVDEIERNNFVGWFAN